MASGATTSIKLELMEQGVTTTWGTKANVNFSILDSAISGTTTVSTTGGTTTLTDVNFTDDQAKRAVLYVSGTLSSNATIVIPNVSRIYRVINNCNTSSGTYTVGFKTSSGSAVFVAEDRAAEIYCDGSNSILFTSPIVVFSTGAPDSIGEANSVLGITVIIDGGGSVIGTGIKADLQIPFACTISRVVALADQSGSIVVDIWRDTYANYPPTDADSITASAPVTISAATKSSDSTLTGWTTSVAADDILRFNVDSCSTITRVAIQLKVTRS